jgi:hypothetical protein
MSEKSRSTKTGHDPDTKANRRLSAWETTIVVVIGHLQPGNDVHRWRLNSI